MSKTKTTAQIILAIRRKAGGSAMICPTCGQLATTPYRREIDGAIVEGCIDATHEQHLLHRPGPSRDWHMRAQAVAHREAELQHLLSL